MNQGLFSAIGIETRNSTASAKSAQKSGEKGGDFAALLGGAATGKPAKSNEFAAKPAPGRSDTDTAVEPNPAETQRPRGLDVAQSRHERNAARQAERRETVAEAARVRAEARSDAAEAADESADATDTGSTEVSAGDVASESSGATKVAAANEARGGPRRAVHDAASDAESSAIPAELAEAASTASSEAAAPTTADESAAADDASPDEARADSAAAALRSAGDWLSTVRDAMRLATATDPAAAGSDQTAIGARNGLSSSRPFSMAGDAMTLPDTARALAEGLKVAGTASGANDGPPSFAASLSVLGDGTGLGAGTSPGLGLNLAAERALSALPTELNTLFAISGQSGELPSPLRSTTAAPVSAPAMTLPPEHPDFAEALGERIVWITDAGLSSARIEMNPQQLGAVSVNVQLKNDEAQVSFTADNPATRALLTQTMPQLRELFAGQGLQLMRSQVEQRSASTRDGGASGGFGAARGRSEGLATQRVSRLQLVDAYA